jgi:HK97 gp10 family phage protein
MADEFTLKMDSDWEQKLQPDVDDALKRLAQAVLSDAKQLVPVRSGRLRNSLDAEVSDGEARVGSRDVEYASMVEEGTRHMAAQPYLRPALFKKREL